MAVLRPWLAALALAVCALISLVVFAWSVDFEGPEVVSGLAEAAASTRLEGLALSLHRQAAELHRGEVKRLREVNAPASVRTRERFALANELRDGALLAEAEGDLDLAREWMTEAAQVAPERIDLRCLLTDLRTRGDGADARRMAFLRLVYEHDASCALLMAGESFLAVGATDPARAYLERAIERGPERWATPHLAMARAALQDGETEPAREQAEAALREAEDLHTRLDAAALVRQTGGHASSRWELIARWAWRSYAYVLPSIGIFALLLFSPALVRLIKRGIAAVRSQRGIAESAS